MQLIDGHQLHEHAEPHTAFPYRHVRRFGPQGVLYQVVKILDDKRALIRVLDTGEETPYALDKIFAGPTN